MSTARVWLDAVYREALAATDVRAAVGQALAAAGVRRARVLAVGKAAGPMSDGAAASLDEVLPGSVATVPDGAPGPIDARVRVTRAAHPLPDDRSRSAGEDALARVGDDVPWILCLSGGASALWFVPEPPLDMAGARALTADLLRSGRPIREVNAVRRQASRVAGGRLLRAAARPPEVVLLLSDVLGDDPAVIGSGPCWPEGGLGAPVHRIVGSNRTLVEAATRALEARGVEVVRATWDEDDDVAAFAARYAAAIAPGRGWRAVIGGGEPRVRVPDGAAAGRGGRCTHLALLVAGAIAGRGSTCTFGAFASDGVDGFSGAAGAVVDGATWAAGAPGAPGGEDALQRFDAATWLEARGALLPERPTGVNVQDLHVLLWR